MAERRAHALAAALLVAAMALLGVGTAAGVAGAAEGEPSAVETTGTSGPTDSPTVAEPTTPSTPTTAPTGSPTESPTSSPTTSESPTASPTATVTTTVTTTVTAAPTTPPGSTPVQVQGATLRWGMSNESNNRAFAPGTFNFFSAGALADPGRGGVQIRQDQWQQASGNVSVQKWNGTSWLPATWGGLSTDSSGAALGTPTAGTFSNHTFVFGAGTGTVDAAAGTAHLAWDGDVSVLYYSGMSFFVLSDPVLDVQGGTGEIRATLSGYASSQADPTIWEPVPAQVVTVATLAQVDLSDPRGFVVTPAYLGVTAAGVPQVTTGASAGSFPQSFVDYHGRLGSAPFWYSSGASTDAFKVALPISVSLTADEVAASAGDTSGGGKKKPDTVKNSAPPPPTTQAPADVVAAPAVALPPAAVGPPALVPATPEISTAAQSLLTRPATSVRLISGSAAPPTSSSTPTWPWWTGGALLLLAAACLLLTPAARPVTTPRS